jgi:DNA mismatch repair protein MutH
MESVNKKKVTLKNIIELRKKKKEEDNEKLDKLEELFGKLDIGKKCKEKQTIANIKTKYENIFKNSYTCIKTRNKGGVGHLLETLLDIPHTSDCLDMLDGELKSFPIQKNGKAKESVAITMVDKDNLKTKKVQFEDSRVYKKLENTLFIPYKRDGDTICFGSVIHFTKSNEYFEQIKEDYNDIQNKPFSSDVGKYLQSRTKGAGHGTTSRAFYLRASFMNKLLGTN